MSAKRISSQKKKTQNMKKNKPILYVKIEEKIETIMIENPDQNEDKITAKVIQIF